MKNKHYFLVALLFLVSNAIFAQAPTTASTNLSFTFIEGNRFRVNFDIGNGAKRIIVAKAGSAVDAVPTNGMDYIAGNFGVGDEIAPGEYVVYEGIGNFAFLLDLSHSTIYYIKIFEFNGSNSTTEYLTSSFLEGIQATLFAPIDQATNIQFSDVSGNSMTVSWTVGSGSGRLLIIRENTAVNAVPQDLTSYLAFSGGFGNPSYQIGTGNYVLYSGTLSSVNIINLNPNTTYHFELFEYNGVSGRVYLTPGAIASQLTATSPTLNATNFSFSFFDGDRFRYAFTKGNGGRRIVIAREGMAVTATPVDGIDYTESASFGVGQEIEPGQFVVYDGTGNSNITIRNLIPATTYHLKVFEYDGTGTDIAYLKGDDSMSNPPLIGNQATLSAPTEKATNIQFSNVTGSKMTVSWTKGNGSKRLLIIKENAVVDAVPQDLTAYGAIAGGFGNPTYDIGSGNYGVYGSSGTSVNITNLNPNATYHFELFEYNGNFARVYLRPGTTASQATAPYPTLNATGLIFDLIEGYSFTYSFFTGNGARRFVIARQDVAVTATPEDAMDYTANTIFGDGQEIESGQFVVFNGTGNSGTISGLNLGTTYYLKVFEYNGTGTGTLYLTTTDSTSNPPLSGSQVTITTPTTQASNISFSNISGTSMTVEWDIGDGLGRLLLIKENEAVTVEPTDLTTYNASAGGFGNPTYDIGSGNYVVYSSSGTSVDLTNINTNTTYHFALFEFNGFSDRLYKTPGATSSRLDVDTFNYSIGVKFWPNPSDSYFNIKPITNNNFDKVEIYVYDINGKQVHYNTFNPENVYRFGKELAGGVYFVKIMQAGRMKIKNLIKI